MNFYKVSLYRICDHSDMSSFVDFSYIVEKQDRTPDRTRPEAIENLSKQIGHSMEQQSHSSSLNFVTVRVSTNTSTH